MPYIKLDNIFGGDTIRITGGFHGSNQSNTAMDFSPGNLISPLDGCKVEYIAGSGGQAYFGIRLPVNGDVVLQCVHGKPLKKVGETFGKGEVMGVNVPYYNTKGKREDHWHISIKVNGVWQGVMTYIKRVYNLVLVGSPWSNPYNKWSFYNDRSLIINLPEAVPQPAPDNNVPFVPPAQPEPPKELPEMIAPPEPVVEVKPEPVPVIVIPTPEPVVVQPEPTPTPTEKSDINKEISGRVGQATGVSVSPDNIKKGIGYFATKVVDRLTSSRLWTAVAGPLAIMEISNDQLVFACSVIVSVVVYIVSENLIRYKKNK